MTEHTKEQELLNEIEKLQRQLQIANNRVKKAKYGLVWMDVPEAFEQDSENQMPVLKEVKDRALCNNDGKPTHIFIEGDNYHALTCLNYTHKEKIDLIYIDPPYNTGSDGFRYRDKRVLETFPDGTDVPKDHPLRHSYWLSFMSKRIELAHKLLKDDAVMFISINEEEYSQLKLLCDNIFQGSNYLTTFTIKVRHEDRILKGDKDYHETTEQLLLYRKSPKFVTIKRLQDNTSISKYVYEIEEIETNPEIITFGSKQVEVFKPGQYKVHKGTPSANKFQKINIRGSIKEGNSSGRFHMKYLEKRNNLLGYLYKVPSMGDDEVPYRYFLTRTKDNLLNGSYFQGVPCSRNEIKEVPYPNYLDFEEAFNNVGYEGGIVFRNGKKPVDFMKFLFTIGTLRKDAIILDFFAGSGSTGHAVFEQNSIDGGNRQVILCTNNENNIANEITYPRIKNVINGFQQTKNQKEILFELPLNPKSLIDNTTILDAREQFFSEKFKERYDEIKEEVRKDKYSIFGIIKNISEVKVDIPS
jgi:adenine-specific DNA-methyltransferase